MRLDIFALKTRSFVETRKFNANLLRFGVLTTLLGLSGMALILSLFVSCKSRSNVTPATNQTTLSVDSTGKDADKLAEAESSVPGANSVSSLALVVPGSANDPASKPDDDFSVRLPGVPVVGLEAWQDDRPVKTIVTGKQVLFKLTNWTRDTNTENGCANNPGIVQASWTVGSKPASDVQRFAGQDCRPLDYSGMFTKEGVITVRLDVLSADGAVASAEQTFSVNNSSK